VREKNLAHPGAGSHSRSPAALTTSNNRYKGGIPGGIRTYQRTESQFKDVKANKFVAVAVDGDVKVYGKRGEAKGARPGGSRP
jgi:hypothetical protein